MPQIVFSFIIVIVLIVSSYAQSNGRLKSQIDDLNRIVNSQRDELIAANIEIGETKVANLSLVVRAAAAESELSRIRHRIENDVVRHREMRRFIRRVAENGEVRLTKSEIAKWAEAVILAGDEYDIDPRILIGVAYRESRLGTYSRLPERPLEVDGREMVARVLGDYRNGVWRSCGAFQIQFRYQPETCEDLMDVRSAAMVAARILRELIDSCDSIWYLAAYNGGCRNRSIGPARGYQNRVIEVTRR
jgi:hypothetical protein